MTFQDSWAVCTKCAKQFVFRIEDQRRQAERGEEVTPPELCPSCHAPSRTEYRPEPRRAEPRREARPRPAAESDMTGDSTANLQEVVEICDNLNKQSKRVEGAA